MISSVSALSTIVFAFVILKLVGHVFFGPLSKIPGPRLYGLTQWRLAYDDWRGDRTRIIFRLHQKYGPVVRIGPNEVAFNSLSAMRTIYGAGSGFERTDFYSMFDVYGKQNMFTFGPPRQHAERKKMLAHVYSKSMMVNGTAARMIQEKVKDYLELLEREAKSESEIFSTLHYFSLDAITDFVYGNFGCTKAMSGSMSDRALINDVLDPARRRLSWFAVHLPDMTKWLYTRASLMERLVRPLLPMKKPSTYTGIRIHALQAWKRFLRAANDGSVEVQEDFVMARLWKQHKSQGGDLDDLDIASECADHLLAGIDTTSDSLMFLIWALSMPENQCFQEKLRNEVAALDAEVDNRSEVPSPQRCDQLPYLDAVVKETLRIYAPLPASEPRSLQKDTAIDGYMIPARTVVSMEPYALHRNAEVFEDPTKFNPERWLHEPGRIEMKKWWWAFSSGGRMCIGMQ